MTLSTEEKNIIDRSVNNSIVFGLGLVSNAKEQVEDHGFKWSNEHETYIFEEHVINK